MKRGRGKGELARNWLASGTFQARHSYKGLPMKIVDLEIVFF